MPYVVAVWAFEVEARAVVGRFYVKAAHYLTRVTRFAEREFRAVLLANPTDLRCTHCRHANPQTYGTTTATLDPARRPRDDSTLTPTLTTVGELTTWVCGLRRDGRYAAPESDPTGIRTRVFAVRGRCPWPLDDGAVLRSRQSLSEE